VISAADDDDGRVVASLLSKGSMPDFDASIIALNALSILPASDYRCHRSSLAETMSMRPRSTALSKHNNICLRER
jgi:hypothetical protein